MRTKYRFKMKIHAICLALNEEPFMVPLLDSLYPFCSGISIMSQYDRDWYGNRVEPDKTIENVLSYPDPEGKIRLVIRRWKDEAVARNHEMLSVASAPHQGVQYHGAASDRVTEFHETPDYFLIVDADEIFDTDTCGSIIDYLNKRRPRGMRVTGYQYLWTWNQRIPTNIVHHKHFGFIEPGLLFTKRRRLTWNETRLHKLLHLLNLPDFSARIFGFEDCPEEVGVFHHGCYIGGKERLENKFKKHSHQGSEVNADLRSSLDSMQYEYIETSELPRNIREHPWPDSFIDD